MPFADHLGIAGLIVALLGIFDVFGAKAQGVWLDRLRIGNNPWAELALLNHDSNPRSVAGRGPSIC